MRVTAGFQQNGGASTVRDLRDRWDEKGSAALSDVQMVQVALRLDQTRATDLMERIGGLRGLVDMSPQTLKSMGLGAASAQSFVASLELGRRARSDGRDVISCPADVWPYLMEIRQQPKEHFCCLYLNARNGLIERKTVSIGSVSASLVHPREVFENAITRSASSIILAHNHPSGDATPSREDIDLTARLVDAGRLLGIDVLDHMIICPESFLSLKEQGLM